MPTYTFKRGTKKWTEHMIISEMERFLDENVDITIMPAAPRIVSGVANKRNKPDGGFRDVLKRIKKANRGSHINTF